MNRLPTLGFIGTGMMSGAAITGFCERGEGIPYPIIVSNRTAEKARALAYKYPHRVSFAASFQECADKSDWIILGVLPEAAKEILERITLRRDHKLISFIFSMGKEEIEPLLNCEISAIVHMVPGTFVSETSGPIIQRPVNPEASEIFSTIGNMVPVEKKEEEDVIISLTSMFAPIFSIQDTMISWCRDKGLSEDITSSYVTSLFLALSTETMGRDSEFIHKLATVNTPGGINMQAVEEIKAVGGFKAFNMALDSIHNRITDR